MPLERLSACALALALAIAGADSPGAVDPGQATAPRMEFVAPRPGSYALEKIQGIAEATLLNAQGQATPLSAVTSSKITLLTFFYTYCVDPLGCPFAYQTLTGIRNTLLEDSALARQVRFVGISLDPTHDTPAVIHDYRDGLAGDAVFDWEVLTAPSVRALLPVLDDLGQDVSVEHAADGTPSRTLHHMLKVFLIDRGGTVREIYSLAFLHPSVIVNDIRTLAMENH